ncbi:SDR family oxidoreductase [Mangrovactinospora gilvigrisea]|uniref:SDR family NAD(P)-dependent oxidoreductase n=1 Tax=Mangrovactinospora gilvigrisea TaxID=1428644 RepID=UPI003013148C
MSAPIPGPVLEPPTANAPRSGASTGIGLAIARRFATEGAAVFLTGRRKAELDAAAQQQIGERATGVRSDVSRTADLDRLFEGIAERSGRLDIVVANAGVGGYEPLGQITEEDYERTTAVNLKGTIFTVQKALPLLDAGASVILLSSSAALLFGQLELASRQSSLRVELGESIELFDQVVPRWGRGVRGGLRVHGAIVLAGGDAAADGGGGAGHHGCSCGSSDQAGSSAAGVTSTRPASATTAGTSTRTPHHAQAHHELQLPCQTAGRTPHPTRHARLLEPYRNMESSSDSDG